MVTNYCISHVNSNKISRKHYKQFLAEIQDTLLKGLLFLASHKTKGVYNPTRRKCFQITREVPNLSAFQEESKQSCYLCTSLFYFYCIMNSFIYEYGHIDRSKVGKALGYQTDLHLICQCSLLERRHKLAGDLSIDKTIVTGRGAYMENSFFTVAILQSK